MKRYEHFRTFGAYADCTQADAELRACWQSCTLEALEDLRINKRAGGRNKDLADLDNLQG